MTKNGKMKRALSKKLLCPSLSLFSVSQLHFSLRPKVTSSRAGFLGLCVLSGSDSFSTFILSVSRSLFKSHASFLFLLHIPFLPTHLSHSLFHFYFQLNSPSFHPNFRTSFLGASDTLSSSSGLPSKPQLSIHPVSLTNHLFFLFIL
ncbi:hypothetical protein VNO77_21075 [Canavalia gladiata]|uniref:Uncharacterized protein n=1 Tax=Canavalia gladiata TaxID=3824 RepID=A0AAN9LVH2_CANGL